MGSSVIKEKLAKKIKSNGRWLRVLDDTNPANYGVEYWEVNLEAEDVDINYDDNCFYFANALFSFDVSLLSSGQEGFSKGVTKDASGDGKFEFMEDGNVRITEMNINCDASLY